MVRLTFFFLLCFSVLSALGQSHKTEIDQDYGTENNIIQRKHAIHYLNGMTLIPEVISETHEGKKMNFINTIGVSYQYQFTAQYAAMIITDLEMENYMLSNEDEIYFRENVVMVLLAGSYEPFPQIEVFAGAGVEFERGFHIGVAKFGVEYHLHIANDWYVSPEITMDVNKLHHTYTGAFKFTRKFGKILKH